jgi:hypothetical protein
MVPGVGATARHADIARPRARRPAAFGSIACLPFVALVGLGWGWRPLNIMATLLAATVCAWLIEVGGAARRVAAAAVFVVVGGALVEFWCPGLALS